MENEERENTRDVGESGDMVERERGEREVICMLLRRMGRRMRVERDVMILSKWICGCRMIYMCDDIYIYIGG